MSESYESGFEKMTSNMGYSVELTAHEANCIVTEIERLETELLARDDILIGVAHGDQYEIASLGWHKANSGKRYEKLAVEE